MSVSQRVYFAYLYYKDEVQANNHMEDLIANNYDRSFNYGNFAGPKPTGGHYLPRGLPIRGGYAEPWRGATEVNYI